MNIDSAFRPMIELEKVLADLYASWSEAFESDNEAAFVFFKMSNEEKGHASLIEFQRRILQKNPTLLADVEVDLALIRATVEEVRRFREAAARPSVPDAVLFALSLESSAAESHFKNALRQKNPEIERLLSCLGGDDRAHLTRLKEFATKRGIEVPATV